jgi:uncharacterized membrane protein (UPF0127 family)
VLAILVLTFFQFFGPNKGIATLRVGGQNYALHIVTTAAAQQKGLGGRASLSQQEGMLFAYRSEAVRCFWMKDMHFPLDIIWLNEDKQVVHMQPNIVPSTYPDEFCPNPLAQYVIELNAGEALRADIRTGQTLTF